MASLQTHVDFVLKMIASVDNHEQLNICKDMKDTFVVQRFKNHSSYTDINRAITEIDTAIMDKERTYNYM